MANSLVYVIQRSYIVDHPTIAAFKASYRLVSDKLRIVYFALSRNILLQAGNCTLREAVIIGSIIEKVTIPPLHARLAEYYYKILV